MASHRETSTRKPGGLKATSWWQSTVGGLGAELCSTMPALTLTAATTGQGSVSTVQVSILGAPKTLATSRGGAAGPGHTGNPRAARLLPSAHWRHGAPPCQALLTSSSAVRQPALDAQQGAGCPRGGDGRERREHTASDPKQEGQMLASSRQAAKEGDSGGVDGSPHTRHILVNPPWQPASTHTTTGRTSRLTTNSSRPPGK